MRTFLACVTVPLFMATTGLCSSSPPVAMKADLDLSGPRIVLEVEATAAELRDCTIEVMSSTEGVAPAMSVQANLVRGLPMRVSIPIQPSAVLAQVSLRAAVRRAGDVGVVANFHFWRDENGHLVEVTETEHTVRLLDSARKANAAFADNMERSNLAAALATGRKPAPSEAFLGAPNSDLLPGQAAPESPSQLAWDALATSRFPLASRTPLGGECGINRPDQNNYSIQVQGSFGYHDDYEGGTRTALSSYPVTVDTEIEVTNDCQEIGFITRTYSGTSDANGNYSISALTRVSPGSQNPVLGFGATPGRVGLKSGGLQIVQVHLGLAGIPQGTWTGSTYQIYPVFNTTNVNYPYPFLFRWNEELTHLVGLWSTLGMPSSKTNFRAAYDASGSCTFVAYFSGSDGYVTINPCGTWSPKFLMAHEAGHNLQYALQGNAFIGAGLQHTACQAVSDVSGFVEGFADWHGEFFESQGRDFYDLPCSGAECYSSCTTHSHWMEANVAAFFWDVFDSANVSPFDDASGQTMIDSVSYPTSLLLNWGFYTTFPMFYADFTSRGIWGGGLPATNLLKVANKVDLP